MQDSKNSYLKRRGTMNNLLSPGEEIILKEKIDEATKKNLVRLKSQSKSSMNLLKKKKKVMPSRKFSSNSKPIPKGDPRRTRTGSILTLKGDDLKHHVEEIATFTALNQSEHKEMKNKYSKKLSKFIFHPHETFRLRWDFLSILLIAYNAFVVPYEVAFYSGKDSYASGLERYWSSIFDRLVDLFFIVDIIVNFFTAVELPNKQYYDLKSITLYYLRTWFLIDCVAAFPFNLIFTSSALYRTNQLSKVFKLFRLIRLFRMFRMFRIMNRLEYALLIRSAISSVVKFFGIVIVTSHWFSCIFYGIAASGHEVYAGVTINDFPQYPSWADSINLFDEKYSNFDRYFASLYYSIMLMSTVGYGDVATCTTEERIFSIIAMIIGAGIFAYGITNIVAIVARLTSDETHFRQQMDIINAYMLARDLPVGLKGEIREFIHNMRKSHNNDLNDENEILSEISCTLRTKVALAINDHFLKKMPFFIGADPNFILEISLSMKMICFAALEDVVIEGEIGNEMFFIFRGAVEVLKNGKRLMILSESQYFGELALLNKNSKRTATVRTLCFCELRLLLRDKFFEAITHYPGMKERIVTMAAMRQQSIPTADSDLKKKLSISQVAKMRTQLNEDAMAVMNKTIETSKLPMPRKDLRLRQSIKETQKQTDLQNAIEKAQELHLKNDLAIIDIESKLDNWLLRQATKVTKTN